jgi:hypothetical protein
VTTVAAGGLARPTATAPRLTSPYPNGIPAPAGACPTCAYNPCACSRTDEALDLVLEAEALGIYSGFDAGGPE